MNNINSYIIINKKTNFITNLFIIISIMIFISLIIISQLKYQRYYQIFGQVIKNENNYQLSIFLPYYKLNIIKNDNVFIIDELEYKYKINQIKEGYIISDNNEKYLNVILDVELNEKDRIVNNTLQIKILESNEKIFYYLKEYLKKGCKK